MLLSRAGACRSAQRRTPTRRLLLPVLLTADAIPSALRIGEARQISIPILLAFLCHPADSAIASDARKDHTRVSTGVPTRVRQVVIRPWPHLVCRERGTLTSGYGSRTMAYAVDCECGGSAARS